MKENPRFMIVLWPQKKLMIRQLIATCFLLGSLSAIAQTPIHSFECQIPASYHDFTTAQVDSFISRGNFEKYRLQGVRDTLTFDNGFTVILFSAHEIVQSGLISSTAAYPVSRPERFKLPVFHLTAQGWIAAAYTDSHDKPKAK